MMPRLSLAPRLKTYRFGARENPLGDSRKALAINSPTGQSIKESKCGEYLVP
jgi:hypothetical protein